MYKFILLLIFDAVILQPVRCIFGIIIQFLWHPPFISPAKATQSWSSLYAQADWLYSRLDRVKYGLDDDSAKFLGMLAFVRPENEWSNFMRLVDTDGNLKRNLKDPYPDDTPDFSTDMLSGFMLGVYGNLNRMTKEERERLTKVWERASWSGFPMLVSSANNGKKLFGRGHVYRFWWIFGCEEILMCLAWLALGYRVTGKAKYKIAYWLMQVFLLPSLLLTCPDAQIFIGPIYWMSAHNTHSRALVDFVGAKLTNSCWFREALRILHKRHGSYNADIALLYCAALESYLFSDVENCRGLLSAALLKGNDTTPTSKRYLELGFPPKLVCYSPFFCNPKYRGNDYIWERSPLKGYVYSDQQRVVWGLDVVFPVLFAIKTSVYLD